MSRLSPDQLRELVAAAPADTKVVVIDPLSKQLPRLPDDVLRDLADTAFVTINWAKRKGFKRDQQIEQVARAFELRLGYRQKAEEISSEHSR